MTYVVHMKKRARISVTGLAFLWTCIAALSAGFELSREASAIGLASLTLVPLVLVWLTRRHLLVADPIIVLGAVWMLATTLSVLAPSLYKDRMWYTLSPWSLDHSALWMYRSWAACSVGYWGLKLLLGERCDRAARPFDRSV